MTMFWNADKSRFYKIIQLRHPPQHLGKHQHRSRRGFDTEKVHLVRPVCFQSGNSIWSSGPLREQMNLKKINRLGPIVHILLLKYKNLPHCYSYAQFLQEKMQKVV